jgi:hypothetical protein
MEEKTIITMQTFGGIRGQNSFPKSVTLEVHQRLAEGASQNVSGFRDHLKAHHARQLVPLRVRIEI